jgi:hypothetical protein
VAPCLDCRRSGASPASTARNRSRHRASLRAGMPSSHARGTLLSPARAGKHSATELHGGTVRRPTGLRTSSRHPDRTVSRLCITPSPRLTAPSPTVPTKPRSSDLGQERSDYQTDRLHCRCRLSSASKACRARAVGETLRAFEARCVMRAAVAGSDARTSSMVYLRSCAEVCSTTPSRVLGRPVDRILGRFPADTVEDVRGAHVDAS